MDRLTPQARRNVERNAARNTLGTNTAMAEALHRALQDTEPKGDNPARVCRLKWRTPSGHIKSGALTS